MSTNEGRSNVNTPFIYDEEPLAAGTIRLLKFEGSPHIGHASDQRLKLTLFTASLPSANSSSAEPPVHYITLSYIWGENKHGNNPEILINKRPFKIWPNLQKALVHLEDEVNLPIWIDAICINQQDVDERAEQVKQMTQIYQNAVRTIIWLGEAEETTGQLMTHLNKIGGDAIQAGLNRLTQKDLEQWPDFESKETGELSHTHKVEIKDKLEALFPKMTNGYDGLVPFPLQSLVDMSNDNPWFRRVWVIQELLVSTDYTFMCGKWTVPGDKFIAAFQFSFIWAQYEIYSLDTLSHGGSLLEVPSQFMSLLRRNGRHNGWVFMKALWAAASKSLPMLNYRAMATLEARKRWPRDHPEDCPTLKAQLCQAFVVQGSTGGLDATDPRDRIYGFLGIASDATKLGMDPKIFPDYKETSTVEVVYTKVARELIQHGHLDILTLCRPRYSGTRNSKLPSWVPDWEKKDAICWPWGGYIQDHLFHASGEDQPKFVACDTALPALASVLTIKARFIGVLSEVGTTWVGGWRENFDIEKAALLIAEVKGFLQKSNIFNTPAESDKVFWRIPVGDQELNDISMGHRATETSFRECQEMMNFAKYVSSTRTYMKDVLTHKHKAFDMPNMLSYTSSMRDIHNAKPFLSKDDFGGYVGLCPSQSEVGDEIFIPIGSHVPLVFRKDGDGFYRVVGEAYVQGLMDGEALKLDLQIRDVQLK